MPSLRSPPFRLRDAYLAYRLGLIGPLQSENASGHGGFLQDAFYRSHPVAHGGGPEWSNAHTHLVTSIPRQRYVR